MRNRARRPIGPRPRRGTRIARLIACAVAGIVTACAPSHGATSTDPDSSPATIEAAQPGVLPPQRAQSNVPMRRLAPGERPPQFVLFSFDGVGVTPNWDMFLEVAERVDARFTVLMTGLLGCLLLGYRAQCRPLALRQCT
ncbi:hypothetical protein ACFWU5_28725 [Nocardia sp. NPDC058640]|uniref:hypothetical protein n=1 Tax=Nocardia sp. NPDC058640 TaxID=3346571 RepID=UPI00365BD4A8